MSDRAAVVSLRGVTYVWEEETEPVFRDLSLELPRGVVSLVGQNGTGKSTLLLLAGGVLLPNRGSVLIRGVDSRELRDETERHRHVSFIYQNMEFETEEPVSDLLRSVHEGGFLEKRDPGFIAELIEVFELGRCLERRTQELSKGELQRTILAFSLLYGSPILIMDEPVFAMEEQQKYRAFEYLTSYAAKKGITIYYSAHELELTERYSEHMLLFHKDAPPLLGPTPELYVRERIEEAYQVPITMLKTRERLYRKILIERTSRERQAE